MSSEVCIPLKCESTQLRPKSAKYSIRFGHQRPKTENSGTYVSERSDGYPTISREINANDINSNNKASKCLKRPKTARSVAIRPQSTVISQDIKSDTKPDPDIGVTNHNSQMHSRKNSMDVSNTDTTKREENDEKNEDEIKTDFLGKKCNTVDLMNLENGISNIQKRIIRYDEEYFLTLDPIDYFYNAEFDLFPVDTYETYNDKSENSVKSNHNYNTPLSSPGWQQSNETFVRDTPSVKITDSSGGKQVSDDDGKYATHFEDSKRNNERTGIRNSDDGQISDKILNSSTRPAGGFPGKLTTPSFENIRKTPSSNLKPLRDNIHIQKIKTTKNKSISAGVENNFDKPKLNEYRKIVNELSPKGGQTRIPRPIFKTTFRNANGIMDGMKLEQTYDKFAARGHFENLNQPKTRLAVPSNDRQLSNKCDKVNRTKSSSLEEQKDTMSRISLQDGSTSKMNTSGNKRISSNKHEIYEESEKSKKSSKYDSVNEARFNSQWNASKTSPPKSEKYHEKRENSYKQYNKWALSSRTSENKAFKLRQMSQNRTVVNETYHKLGIHPKTPSRLEKNWSPELSGYKRPFSEDSKFIMPPKHFIRSNFHSKVDDKVLAKHTKNLTVHENNLISANRPKSDRYPIPLDHGRQGSNKKPTQVPRKLKPIALRFEEVNF